MSAGDPGAAAVNYSKVEKFVHRLALVPLVSRQMAFDLDCLLAKMQGNLRGENPDGPVYICGMARSGTTILLQMLASCPEFASLTYRAMPFVMSPRLGRHFGGTHRKQLPDRERFHGDGLLVGLDTPEAFEEVYWLSMGAAIADRKTYRFVAPDEDVLQRFSLYRQLVAGPDKRYLSKNNNNIGRIAALLRNPKATLVFVIRDPLACAASMLRMHQSLLTADPFVREYMGWLGHHEFGSGHLPHDFAVVHQDQSLSPDALEYWLDYWNCVHDAVLSQVQHSEQVMLLVHEDLQTDASATLSALSEKLNINPLGLIHKAKIIGPSKYGIDATSVSKSRLSRSQELYNAYVSGQNRVRQ